MVTIPRPNYVEPQDRGTWSQIHNFLGHEQRILTISGIMPPPTFGGSPTEPTRLRQIALVARDLDRAEHLLVSHLYLYSVVHSLFEEYLCPINND